MGGDQAVIKLFEHVLSGSRSEVKGSRIVIGKPFNDCPEAGRKFGREVFHIPRKEITFEKVTDAGSVERTTFFESGKVLNQPIVCKILPLFQWRRGQIGVSTYDNVGEQLRQDGKEGMSGEEEAVEVEFVWRDAEGFDCLCSSTWWEFDPPLFVFCDRAEECRPLVEDGFE